MIPAALAPRFKVPGLGRHQVAVIVLAELADVAPEMVFSVEVLHPHRGDAIVSDRVERDDTGASGVREVMTQRAIERLGFRKVVGADQSIENLPHRQWPVFSVLIENTAGEPSSRAKVFACGL